MGVEHPLVGPVVVGRHDERRVGAEGRGASGRLDRGAGVVAAGAGDDRDAGPRRALGDGLDGELDEAVALGGRQGGRLAGRPDGDEAVDPGEDLPCDEPPEGGLVDGAVGGERRDEGGERAAEARACGRWRNG